MSRKKSWLRGIAQRWTKRAGQRLHPLTDGSKNLNNESQASLDCTAHPDGSRHPSRRSTSSAAGSATGPTSSSTPSAAGSAPSAAGSATGPTSSSTPSTDGSVTGPTTGSTAQQPLQQDLTEFAVAHALQELTAPHPVYTGLTMEQGLAMEEQIISTSHALFQHSPEFYQEQDHQLPMAIVHGQDISLTPLISHLRRLTHFDEHMATVVDEYITGHLASQIISNLSDLDFYRGIRVRLCSIAQLMTEPWARDALAATDWKDGEPIPQYLESREFPVRPWSTSTVIRLCVSHQGIVHNLTPDLLEGRDTLPELWHMGYRNLWQELVDSDLHVQSSEDLESHPATNLSSSNPELLPDADMNVGCWVFQGSSCFVGSLPLFVNEFMHRMLPQVDISKGLICGSPHRHMTVVAEVGTGPRVAGSMSVVFTMTAENHGLHPAPLSTEVNVLHDGQVEPIKQVRSEQLDGGRSVRFEIQPPEYLIKRIMEGMKGQDGSGEDNSGEDGTP